jgi:hypothetical protein
MSVFVAEVVTFTDLPRAGGLCPFLSLFPMRLHANLGAPRSEELAWGIESDALPATANFRKV